MAWDPIFGFRIGNYSKNVASSPIDDPFGSDVFFSPQQIIYEECCEA